MTRIRTVLALTAAATVLASGPAWAGDVAASPRGVWHRTTASGVHQTITFEKGRVFGKAGCNNFAGEYTQRGGALDLGPLATTMMACPPTEMAAEAAFLKKLNTVDRFAVSGSRLTLTGPDGSLRFSAA